MLSFGQVTRTTPELTPFSPNHHSIVRTLSSTDLSTELTHLFVTRSGQRLGAVVAEWYRDRGLPCQEFEPVPLKTRRVGQRCALNLSRAETSFRWCGVVVRRGGASSGVVHVT
ncbi:uncharacterized protein TNCV_2257891 [Trichonephila clavipes]|nr:uncharacterized protein TNCV_2257891 [Trichonephila clavipes]